MLKAGIVGLPNVGKSTLFNALLRGHQAEAANFPFCTIEPNQGIVNVADHRLQVLADMFDSKRVVPAAFEFVDIAGLVRGASEGAGLGNQFLSHIREVQAIVLVARCFETEAVHHVDGKVDARRDLETVELELALADLAVIGRRRERLAKQKRSGSEEAAREDDILARLEAQLQEGELPEVSPEESSAISHLNLLRTKPHLIAANLSEQELAEPRANPHFARLAEERQGVPVIPLSAQLESELCSLSPEEGKEYLAELGLSASGVDMLIRGAFEALGLMVFLTAGESETRAWPIPRGFTAQQAAAEIHSDIARGFIKAEVISFEELQSLGSKARAKELGRLRLEGRDYVMRDGDVVEFKFNA